MKQNFRPGSKPTNIQSIFFHGRHLEANPNKYAQQIYRGIVFIIKKVSLTTWNFW